MYTYGQMLPAQPQKTQNAFNFLTIHSVTINCVSYGRIVDIKAIENGKTCNSLCMYAQ
jgi:hypothetical protein